MGSNRQQPAAAGHGPAPAALQPVQQL